jgi:hypothetical protein
MDNRKRVDVLVALGVEPRIAKGWTRLPYKERLERMEEMISYVEEETYMKNLDELFTNLFTFMDDPLYDPKEEAKLHELMKRYKALKKRSCCWCL